MSWVIKAVNRTHTDFLSEGNKEWKEPFMFVQGADTQFGMFVDYMEVSTEPKWAKEIELAELAVKKVNEMRPKPKFYVLCGDLCHDFYDKTPDVRAAQDADFKKVYCKLDPSIPLVCVCGNHDVGDNPTYHSVRRQDEVVSLLERLQRVTPLPSLPNHAFGGVQATGIPQNDGFRLRGGTKTARQRHFTSRP